MWREFPGLSRVSTSSLPDGEADGKGHQGRSQRGKVTVSNGDKGDDDNNNNDEQEDGCGEERYEQNYQTAATNSKVCTIL
tara:strand:+ start:326 stop:565 length:240 start_codon:yes stop_codon:yes gene_type:complete